MSASYFMGIDIGTTRTKAIVCAADGTILGAGSMSYRLHMPRAGWAELRVSEIEAAVLGAVRDALARARVEPAEVEAVGLGSAMHTLLAVDRVGNPLTNCITYADNRSRAQAAQLRQSGLADRLYRRTGTPVHPMSPLTKIIWLREMSPDVFTRAAKLISVKEYVLWRVLGRYIIDYALASTTGLFNIEQLSWDSEALEAAGIRPQQLSELVPPTYTLSASSLANPLGLAPRTKIVVGSSDGVLANVGVGATQPGQVAVTIGTSGAVRTLVGSPLIDSEGRTFCYVADKGRWIVGGPTNNGGLALQWLKDALAPESLQRTSNPYDLLMESAAQVPPGADGLLFLPFLTGERAPHWNEDARGIFFGVALHHGFPHVARAVLEGVVINTYTIARALYTLTGPASEVRISGGFLRPLLTRQLLADVFGVDVQVPQISEAGAFGAMMLAMHATGSGPDPYGPNPYVEISDRHTPSPQAADVYRQMVPLYERIYAHTAEDFEALARLRGA